MTTSSGRVTRGRVDRLEEGEVFVFGSNEAGRHGKGAAKTAQRWGAKDGVGEGMSGRTYAIPTKNSKIRTLGQTSIGKYVDAFLRTARERPDLTFLVTEVGCGLAGYSAEDIAPMFADASSMPNVHLPQSFWNILMR
jgi:hypothetical protein